MTKPPYLVLLALLVLVVAACGGRPVRTPLPQPTAPPPVSTYDIVNIVWQWVEMIETEPAVQSVVPDPDSYTLIFRPDGQFHVQADCNSGGGTYMLQGDSLTLELGSLTMAVCPPESLHDGYLGLLDNAGTASRVDGRLVLHLRDGSTRMIFNNGGPADVSAGGRGMDIDPLTFTLDTMGLPYSWQPSLVPATPYDSSQPPGPVGLPEHIQINFGVVGPGDKQPGDPVIYVIPVEAYKQLWEAAGDPAVSNTLDHLRALLAGRPSPIPPFGLPVLPFEEVVGANDLAVLGNYLDLRTFGGLRFVGRVAQDFNPVTNEGLRYIFQGFSSDGQYLIAFYYPVTTGALPHAGSVTYDELQRMNSDPHAYLQEEVDMLTSLAGSDWEPNLSILDSVLASLSFGDGGSATGGDLVGLWKWFETALADGTRIMLGDPDRYTIEFRADGTLSLQADCNRASGTYLVNDGALSIELGPMTMAECGLASLYDDFVQHLSAAGTHAIYDGNLVINLIAGAGDMKLAPGR